MAISANIYDQLLIQKDGLMHAACMHWASLDLSKIGNKRRKIENITNEILVTHKKNRNDLGVPYLQTAFYLYTAISTSLLIRILSDTSSYMMKKQITLVDKFIGTLEFLAICTYVLVFSILFSTSLFLYRARNDQCYFAEMQTIKEISEGKFRRDINLLSAWKQSNKDRISEFKEIKQRGKELLKPPYFSKKNEVKDSLEQMKAAYQKAKQNLKTLNALPEIVKKIINSADASIPSSIGSM